MEARHARERHGAPEAAALEGVCRLLRTPAPSSTDWSAAVALALRHGLGPALHGRTRGDTSGSPPPDALRRSLRTSFVAGTLGNQALFAQAAPLLRALAEAGIPVVALKGMHLASAVYEAPGLRPMSDIDLLVPRDRLRDAERLLLEMGYGYGPRERPAIERLVSSHHHLPPFLRSGAYPVEVHWTIERPGSPFSVDVDGLWARSRPVTVAGAPARGLGAEDLLLHLCLHAVHQHGGLVPARNFYDILVLVERSGATLDWDRCFSRARAWKAERALCCGLELARHLFDLPLAAPVLARSRRVLGDPAPLLRTLTALVSRFESHRRLSGDAATLRSLIHTLRRAGVDRDTSRPRGLAFRILRRLGMPLLALLRHRRLIAGVVRLDREALSDLRTASQRRRLEAWLGDGPAGGLFPLR